MRYRCARPEGTRARLLDALPLRYMSAITKRSGKMSALPPPPLRLLYEGERLVCICGGRRCRQAAGECNGVWLGRMPARPTLYHTLVMVCGRASHRVHPKMGASFWLPLGSYAGMLSPLLWTTPNLGCTPLTGRIPDHWEDLPDHWRLRPGRWVWPHLTDNQLACTHNNPGYTRRNRRLGTRPFASSTLLLCPPGFVFGLGVIPQGVVFAQVAALGQPHA